MADQVEYQRAAYDDHYPRVGWLPYELVLATRLAAPRRLLGMGPGRALDRISALDDRLTSRLPDLALYMVTVLSTG